MLSIGLDPSLTGFGWCVHRSDCCGPGRVVAKGEFSTASSDLYILRYTFLRDSLNALFREYPDVLYVGYETPPFGEQWSEGLYGLFLFASEAIHASRRNVVFFDPQRVKLLARMDSSVRRGTMDKSAMIEAARADTSISKWTHNEADAYIIARSAARFWGFLSGVVPEEGLTPSERQCFVGSPAKPGKKSSGLVSKADIRFFKFAEEVTADGKKGC